MGESISISIPAFNEEGTIEELVRESLKVLAAVAQDHEVLVIDDGSRDRTGEIIERLTREIPRVRVIHHERNLGFGLTLQEVFGSPRTDWVFFIPGDGQIPPGELLKLWPHRGEADFILGWRVRRQDPWRRRWTAAIYNLMISAALGRRIHDVDSVVLFRRAILERVRLAARSVFLHAEFCLKAAAAGARILEVPIDHHPRRGGEARGNRPSVIWATLRELIAYLLDRRRRA